MRSTVWSVGFDPSGKKLVSGSSDETVKVWSVGSSGTFECESTLAVDSGEYGVLSVSFSPKDNVIAAGCCNGKIHLVDAVAGEVKSTLTGHSERVNCVVFSPNGKVIASCSGKGYMRDNSVRLWDASTGEPIGSPLTGHTRYVPAFPCSACSQNRLLTIK